MDKSYEFALKIMLFFYEDYKNKQRLKIAN